MTGRTGVDVDVDELPMPILLLSRMEMDGSNCNSFCTKVDIVQCLVDVIDASDGFMEMRFVCCTRILYNSHSWSYLYLSSLIGRSKWIVVLPFCRINCRANHNHSFSSFSPD